MESTALLSFGLVVILASCIGVLFKYLKLPLIVAYLTAGLLVFVLGKVSRGFEAELAYLPQVGLSFLLFLVGMELDFRKLTEVGAKVAFTAIANMTFVTAVGFGLGRLLGYQALSALYLGIGLSFSSTILVVKFLADNKDADSLHGRVSLGILLVQDLVAVVVLMFLSFKGSVGVSTFMTLGVKGVALGLAIYFLSAWGLPRLMRLVSRWSELLFLTAVSVCFLLGGISKFLGFSFEIGAFLAGMALGSSEYKLAIAAKVKPLRDLFVAVFFVDLGTKLGRSLGAFEVVPALWMLGVVMIVKPLVFLLLLAIVKFRRFTSFWVSLSLAQVSEFSLIMLAIASSVGEFDPKLTSSMAIVAIVSMILSGTLIGLSKSIYTFVSPLLRFIKALETKIESVDSLNQGHVVLIGCDRSGLRILNYLKQSHAKVVVVDFNPDVHEKLRVMKVKVIFGDISEAEVAEESGIARAKLIISTVRDMDDSLAILSYLRKRGKLANGTKVILSANSQAEADYLLVKGATRVVVPLSLEGEYIVTLLKGGFVKGVV